MHRALSLLLLLVCLPLGAQVYRWVDPNGVVHYADKAQTPDAKPAQLPQIQALTPRQFIGAAPGDDNAAAAAPKVAATGEGPVITTPAANETIRNAEQRVTISVGEAPQAGQGLIYYVDGAAQNTAPAAATSWIASGVERGTHQASVALVDAQGGELARSAPVTFFMKPPDADMARRAAAGH